MEFHYNIFHIALVLFTCTTKVYSVRQPSYQVSLKVLLHPQEPPVHVCNGVIVQSRLILTTASCVYYKFSSKNSSVISIDPSMISVISGTSTAFNEELKLQVADIFVADKFNYTTGVNDLALLRLNGILPLDTREDISWITLEDDEVYEGPCLANFYVQNAANDASNYIQSEELPLLESESCSVVSEQFNKRANDICSIYHLPTGFNCSAVETLQNYSGDRGTGLVCGNKLIGLLSAILPWKNITDCKDKPMKAYFTAVVPHIAWIFNVIIAEDIKMLDEGEYISSAPYAGETNAFIEPQVTEAETTTAVSTTTLGSLQTIEPITQYNNSAVVNHSKTNWQLSFVILGLIQSIAHA